MNKDDLKKIEKLLIETLLQSDIDVEEISKLEVGFNLLHFFADYEKNIKVLQREKGKYK